MSGAARRGKKDNPCGTCKEECTLGTGLSCAFCETWFHTKCVDISTEQAEMLDQLAKVIAGPAYLCAICRKLTMKISKSFKAFETRILDLEGTVEKLTAQCNLLAEKVEKNEGKTEQVRTGIIRVEKDVERGLEKTVTEVEEKMRKEMGERDARSENLVIYGLVESKEETADLRKADDLVKVIEMANQIEVTVEDGVEVKWRAGKKEDGKVRPLIIKVSNDETRKKMMSNARFLKRRDGWEKIFIDQDLTKKQREEGKLEEERLKKEAEERNAEKNGEEEEEEEGKEGKWIVVGRRGKQRIVRAKEKAKEKAKEPRNE